MKYFRQYLIIFTVLGNTFLIGMTLGWTSPAIVKLSDPTQNPLNISITDSQTAILSSITYTGLPCVMIIGYISNLVGRKPILVMCTITYLAGWIIMYFAPNIYMLYFGKILCSCAAGSCFCINVVYLSETVSVSIRGFALTVAGVFSNLGIFIMYSIGPFVTFEIFCVVPAAMSGFCLTFMVFIPESPIYLKSKGKTYQAKKIQNLLEKSSIYFKSENQTMPNQNTNEGLDRESSCLQTLFCRRKNLKSLLLCTIILILQMFSGINAVIAYMNSIFQSSGSSVPSHIATIIVGAVQLLSTLTSSMLVERLGRRPLLLISCLVTSATNLLLGIQFYLESVKSEMLPIIVRSWLPIICLTVFALFYWIGLGTIPSSLPGELLDPKIKSIGASLCFTVETLISITVIASFNFISSSLGSYTTFWMYSFCCAFNFVLIYKWLPETKGKTFAEIQERL